MVPRHLGVPWRLREIAHGRIAPHEDQIRPHAEHEAVAKTLLLLLREM